MSKIDTDDLEIILSKNNVDPAIIKQVVADAEEAAEMEKADKDPAAPKGKYKLVLIAVDPDNKFEGVENLPIYAVKVPEALAHTEVLATINKAVYHHNANTRKGKKYPIRKIAEAFENVGAKSFKPEKNPIMAFAKEPIIVVVSDGRIPTAN